MYVCGYNFWW